MARFARLAAAHEAHEAHAASCAADNPETDGSDDDDEDSASSSSSADSTSEGEDSMDGRDSPGSRSGSPASASAASYAGRTSPASVSGLDLAMRRRSSAALANAKTAAMRVRRNSRKILAAAAEHAQALADASAAAAATGGVAIATPTPAATPTASRTASLASMASAAGGRRKVVPKVDVTSDDVHSTMLYNQYIANISYLAINMGRLSSDQLAPENVDLLTYLPKCLAYMQTALTTGGRVLRDGLHPYACACACVLTGHTLLGLVQVLVHCDTGVSRSAAVCCAYIMAHTLVPYSEAIALVKVSGVPLSCCLTLAPADVQHLCRASDGVWETRAGRR